MKKKSNLKFLFNLIFGGTKPKIYFHLNIAQRLKQRNLHRLARYTHNRMQKYGVFISEKSSIDTNLMLPHPVGIVIGEGVKIGRNVRIFQNVTLGGARVGDFENSKYPKIGDNAVIFAGAVIVGDISIGKNAVIGANSVVLNDVPDNSTCVGAPGRII